MRCTMLPKAFPRSVTSLAQCFNGPLARCKDEQRSGKYRSKRVILEMYDQMAALPKIEVPHPKGLDEEYLVPDVSQFETWLSPPPADPGVAHAERG